MQEKNTTFGSKFGTLAVVAGSVIGLGNIWRFPYLAGSNGGSAFIFIYIICTLLISVPLLMSEFFIGRSTSSNAYRAFKKLSTSKVWPIVGMLSILTVFFVLAFYSVVAGWSLTFFKNSMTTGFTGREALEIQGGFKEYMNTGWKPGLAAIIFLILNAAIVVGGIQQGIEKINKILMPILAVILVVLFFYSMTMTGFKEATHFLLTPDFSKITFKTVLAAIGQSFFSMSLGMGCMITYGAYIKKETSLPSLAITISISDLLIALIAGFAIFPGVFTFGIEPTSGPTLVFETLPLVFSKMAGGNIFGLLFFLLVFIAAITSSVSMLESIVLFIKQELKVTRLKAVISITALAMVLGVLAAFSQVDGSSLVFYGHNLFDILNHSTDRFMMPVGSLFVILFVGWWANKELVRNEITNNGLVFNKGYQTYLFAVKYIIPPVLSLFILNLFGVL